MGNVWYEGRLETLPASPVARMLLFQWVARAGGIAGSARPSPTAVGIGQQKDQDCASSGPTYLSMDEQHLLKVMKGYLCFSHVTCQQLRGLWGFPRPKLPAGTAPFPSAGSTPMH